MFSRFLVCNTQHNIFSQIDLPNPHCEMWIHVVNECFYVSRRLYIHFQIMSGYPHQGRNRGLHVLQAMKVLCPLINENLVELWDKVVPKLISYITGRYTESTIYPCLMQHAHQPWIGSFSNHHDPWVLCNCQTLKVTTSKSGLRRNGKTYYSRYTDNTAHCYNHLTHYMMYDVATECMGYVVTSCCPRAWSR